MDIVPIDKIPTEEEIVDTPTADLLKIYKTCQEMASLCRKHNGVGLAAPQVGIPWRLFVMKNADDNWEFLVNCEYTPIGYEKAVSIEGCLSLRLGNKLRTFRIERWKKVLLEGKILRENSSGKLKLSDVSYETQPNVYNVIYQHETDHTCSVLLSDIGEEIELRK